MGEPYPFPCPGQPGAAAMEGWYARTVYKRCLGTTFRHGGNQRSLSLLIEDEGARAMAEWVFPPTREPGGTRGASVHSAARLAQRRTECFFPVTAEMAVRFGKLFGNGARFWVNLQRSHDLAIEERTVDVSAIPTLKARAG